MKLLISCLLSVSEEESATCHMRPRRGGQGLEFSLFWLFVLDLRYAITPLDYPHKGNLKKYIYIYLMPVLATYFYD